MKVAIPTAVLLVAFSLSVHGMQDDPCNFVNLFIGTSVTNNGHTTPAAAWPFGMVQASPMAGRESWRYCSGYSFEDRRLRGFAQNSVSGTGVPELGDVLILPVRGEMDEWSHAIDKSSEKASPGWYSVVFPEVGITSEATVSEHTAIYSFDYGKGGNAALYLDLQWGVGGEEGNRVLECETHLCGEGSLTGRLKTKGWIERDVFFALCASRPFSRTRIANASDAEKGERWLLSFPGEGGVVQVKVALSAVSEEGAKDNLSSEIPDWDFVRVRKACHDAWLQYLSRISVDGSVDDKVKFYTALYRTAVQPNNIADVDGRCRTAKGEVVKSSGGRFFSTFSLWDTYRAAHPLYTLVAPEKVPEFVNSMLDQFDALGHLPMWGLWGRDTECMLGVHSVSVVADAWAKGFGGFDVRRAYEAVRTTQRVTHALPPGIRRKYFHLRDEWEILDRFGYYPFDIVKGESVSRVLENSYDDWCAARMAEGLGMDADAAFFANRARCYRNLFDNETGFMRGRDSRGCWRDPFDPFEIGHSSETANDYTEGNAHQWVWHVLHDPDDLVRLMGGAEAFGGRLKALFELPDTVKGNGFTADVSGLIGQYAQGNEPNHHVIYLFNLTDEPWRGQELIRRVCAEMFRNSPDGLPGNEDCGQMSAWYVFSSLGFYPVSPASGEYWLGAPQHSRATIQLGGGKHFEIVADGLSRECMYVKSVTLNGRPLVGFKVRHKDIVAGGRLVFKMATADETSCFSRVWRSSTRVGSFPYAP